MPIDDFDKRDLDDIAAIVGLERGDGEDWMKFAIRVIQAFDQPLLKAQYATTINRLVAIAGRLRQS